MRAAPVETLGFPVCGSRVPLNRLKESHPEMSISAFDLISLATTRLGAEVVQSFEDGTNEARFAALIYPNARDAELSNYFWNFTLKTEELVLANETPKDTNWRYAYFRPSFLMREVHALDRAGMPVDYTLEGNRILSNTSPLWFKYHEAKTEDQFPPYFRDLLVSRIAYDMAMPLTSDLQIARLMAQEYNTRRTEARNVDAQGDISYPIVSPQNSPYVTGRF